jgi:hypothetical protein
MVKLCCGHDIMVNSQQSCSKECQIFNTHELYINRIKCFGTNYYAALLRSVLTVSQ